MMDPKNVIPMVTRPGPGEERSFDIFSLLLRNYRDVEYAEQRTRWPNGYFPTALPDREDPDKTSACTSIPPGGVITAGLAIYDTMQLIRPQVSTICWACKPAWPPVLLTAGARQALCFAHATIHMHQVLGGAQGQPAISYRGQRSHAPGRYHPQYFRPAYRANDGEKPARYRS